MAIGSPEWMYKSGEAYTIDQSLKFGKGDTPYLKRDFTTPTNAKKWTLSFWIKRATLDTNYYVLSYDSGGLAQASLGFNSNDRFTFYDRDASSGSADFELVTTQKFRDLSAWYHIILSVDTTDSTSTDRAKIYVNGERVTDLADNTFAAQDYDTILNSAHYVTLSGWTSSPSGYFVEGYLAEVNFIDGQALTPADFGETNDYGGWNPVEYAGSYGTNGFYLPFKNDYSVEGFSTVLYKGTGSNPNYIGGTGFRPDFTWIKPRTVADNHVLYDSVRGYDKQLKANGTDAEDTNGRVASATDGFILRTTDQNQNSSSHNYVAWNWDMGADTPTGFGCVTWSGNDAAQDIANVGFSPDLVWIKCRSHGGNDSFEHIITDAVRGANRTLSSDKTEAESTDNATGYLSKFNPDGFSVTGADATSGTARTYVAWCWDMGGTSVSNTDGTLTSTVMANPTYGQSIVKYTGASGVSDATKVGHGLDSAPEMIIIRDYNNAQYWPVWHKDMHSDGGFDRKMYLNDNGGVTGTDQRRVTSVSSTTFGLPEGASSGGYTESNHIGEEHIAYCFHSVSGYSKIGSYTGNGSTTGPSVNLGFRPAFVMIKVADRTDGGNGAWWMFDSTRSFGTAIGNVSLANTNGAELVDNSNLAIDFLDNGFQLKSSYDEINVNNGNYIYMAFAGGVDSVSDFNTDGSSDSRVKANTTYGQSIVTYTGQSGAQTIGHGLDSAPEMIIAKNRSSVQEWLVYHHSITDAEQKYLRLDTTGAVADNTFWNDTAPTSSVFSVGDSQPINSGHGNDYVAYCFHSVTGYSKFSNYSGSGSAGNKQTLGFAPAFVMIKKTSGTDNWYIHDNTRNPFNPVDKALRANASNVEDDLSTNYSLTFLSDGFEFLGTGLNASGSDYIYMAFADKREYAYWLDQSGNNNDWTSNNLTESDISVDSPTNNFATGNPLITRATYGWATLSEGNLQHTNTGLSSSWGGMVSTIIPNSGKYYAEVFCEGDSDGVIGVFNAGTFGLDHLLVQNPQNQTGQWGIYTSTTQGERKFNGTGTDDDNVTGFMKSNVMGIAVDCDNQKLYIYKNGVVIPTVNNYNIANTASTDAFAFVSLTADSTARTFTWNFGQDSSFAGKKTAQGNQDSNDIGDFYYEPPSGFLALCTDNLPNVAVTPSEHFNTVTYSGTGSTQSITVGFQPDFTWFKSRSANRAHVLVDAVRGVTKELIANSTGAEQTSSATQDLTAFTSTGFDLGTVYNNSPNESGASIVAWNWKANGSGSSNTDGDITSTVSANTDAGFSIVSYTGTGSAATVGHGLSKAPEMIIVKTRSDVEDWGVYHASNTAAPETDRLKLNSTVATADNAGFWNDVAPTSSLFTVGTANTTNWSTKTYIAYCFHSVDGYSKVGSYTGNGSADGTFVYTGFRPAFVMIKNTEASSTEWYMLDSSRDFYNPADAYLSASASDAEATYVFYDFLSNGFKLRNTGAAQNPNAQEVIFLAFAETPFKFSNGR